MTDAATDRPDPSEISDILSRISFLGGLTEDQIETVFARLEAADFAEGSFIARQGEEPVHIHIIQKGSVDLLIAAGDQKVRKRRFAVGDSFGEAALLSLVNNTASFVAAEDCRLLLLSRQSLRELHSSHPDVFCRIILNLARDLARKLQFTDEMLLRQ